MRYLRASVILFSLLCTYEVSAQSASERRLGKQIANKLKVLARRYVDLMLICDSSASVRTSGFNEGKRGSQSIVSSINILQPISRFGSRVGLIEFSETRKTGVRFRFGRHNSFRAVSRAISRLRYDRGGATATARALSLARSEFRVPSRNIKLIWLFTDGKSNTGGSPSSIARLLKRMGVRICVAAIGRSVNMAEINSMASPGCVQRFTSFSSYRRVMSSAAQHLSRTTSGQRSRTGPRRFILKR